MREQTSVHLIPFGHATFNDGNNLHDRHRPYLSVRSLSPPFRDRGPFRQRHTHISVKQPRRLGEKTLPQRLLLHDEIEVLQGAFK